MLYAKTKKVVPQVAADVGLVLWVALWVFLGLKVREGILFLATPAYAAESQAESMTQSIGSAAQSVQEVPLVGEVLSPALTSFGLTIAGLVILIQQVIQIIEVGAIVLAVIVVVVPVVGYLWKWIPWRFHFVREASAGKKLLPADASAELFALRAIAHAPMSELIRITPDPMGAWKRGDTETIKRLADLELAHDGLKLPKKTSRIATAMATLTGSTPPPQASTLSQASSPSPQAYSEGSWSPGSFQ